MIFPSHLLRAQKCSISSYSPTEITEYGNVIQVAKRGNPQKWEISMVTPPLSDDYARELDAFLNRLGGRYNSFTLVSPVKYRGSIESATVEGNHSAGADLIPLDGMTPDDDNAFKAGDFIKFNTHTKVYQIVNNVGTNNSGECAITIFPPLVTDIVNNSTISNATFTLRLTSDKTGISLDATKRLYPVSLKAMEV